MKLFLAILLMCGFSILPAKEAPREHKIMLYYMTTCPHSMRVLQYLETIHKTVPMENLKDNPIAKRDLRAVLGDELRVPCLVIDQEFILGEDPIIEWIKTHDELLLPEEMMQQPNKKSGM